MIDLDLVAMEINRRLGSTFRVHVNGNPLIDRIGLGVEVVMSAQRTPFSIKNVDSETMEITLEIWSNCETAEKRTKVLHDLSEILGHSTGVLESAEIGEDEKYKNYDYAMFFEIQQPMSPPQVDMGVFRQLLILRGNILISGQVEGAVMSNNIFTYLTSSETDGEGNPYRGYLPALSFAGSTEYGSENYRNVNSSVSDVEQVAEVWTAEITALLLNRPFDSYLSKRLQLVKNYSDGNEHERVNRMNEVFTLERILPDYTYSKRMKLLGGNIVEQAGAFAQIKLTFQEITDG